MADDDLASRELVAAILDSEGYSVSLVGDGQEAWRFLQVHPVDLFVTDLRMPGMDGIALLRAAVALPEPPTVILATAFASLESAIEATKLGAYGYLTKPINSEALAHLARKALEERRLQRENRRLQRELAGRYGLDQIIGQSPPMREIRHLVEEVAGSDAPVLLLGRSGTGKEMVARAIHGLSRRRAQPFVVVNCGGLSETLLDSELFGHVRGAFTGAVGARRGLIQAADGGTLFLDEVGEMSPQLQVKLLRTLQDGEVRPLGSERSAMADIRIIAATNRDLHRAVAEGRFREDLYYRINVVCMTLPDLAERREDIPLLARYLLDRECHRAGHQPMRIVPETMDLLQGYDWPGNVRELRNVIQRTVALAPGAEFRPQHLPPEIRAMDPVVAAPWWRGETGLAALERQAILHALKLAHGNRAEAARLLQITERSLYRKLDRHQLRDFPSS